MHASVVGVAPGAYVCISVSDNGAGMDEATLSKATEPFFTTKGPGKGTGLGLSMVHGLAAQSGGKLQISSELGRGTRVQLWLPQSAEQQRKARKTAVAALGAAVDCARARRILVVDDDLLVSTGTAAMLEDLGHTVVETHSAAEALEALDADPQIELVITDHVMPGMTGMQLAGQLERSHPDLPVILATGYAEFPDGPPSTARPRLSKPFSQAELARVIGSATEGPQRVKVAAARTR